MEYQVNQLSPELRSFFYKQLHDERVDHFEELTDAAVKEGFKPDEIQSAWDYLTVDLIIEPLTNGRFDYGGEYADYKIHDSNLDRLKVD